MPALLSKAYMYVVPVEAEVVLIDEDFHAMGDVNWDGVIDYSDLDLLKAAYGSRPGDPNWDQDCDLNGDDLVDIRDVVRAAANFNSKAPSYYTPFETEVAAGRVIAIGDYRVQRLRATLEARDGRRVLFFFSALGVLGRPVVL